MGLWQKLQDKVEAAAEKTAAAHERAKAAIPIGHFGPFTLERDGRVVHRDRMLIEETQPGEPVTARVEKGQDLEKRVTLTRLVMLGGVGGLIWKKRTGGESWLTIESPTVLWVYPVERKDDRSAREFATAVNRTSRVAA